ncbi:MAG TPA: SEC-C metal-binding domain-containing protein, partial [Casimicrobiaceae bacterium]
RGQPVLVGTTSIENSEMLSMHLDKERLPHQVLNAKQHAREAEIVAQAGKSGVITIATNMAGRGTDIVLGGSIDPQILKLREDPGLDPAEKERQIAAMRGEWEARHEAVVKAGGLHIVGTERHESRRIDNQLRGRAGRQGDPGSSRFYLSLEDPLLRIFGGERLSGIMQRLKMPEGEPIEHTIVNRSIAKAQNRVESRNFDIRKQLLEYDDVANDQRRVIYQQRNELLESEDVAETIGNMIRGEVDATFKRHVPPESVEEQWDIPGLESTLASEYQLTAPVREWLKTEPELDDTALRERIEKLAVDAWHGKETAVGTELMRQFERSLMLQTLDHHWREHLASLDHLRQGIHLRGYAQKNPKQEYKREAFELFSDMLDRIKQDVVRVVLTVQVRSEADVQAVEPEPAVSNVQYQHADYDQALGGNNGEGGDTAVAVAPPFVRAGEKVGRNDPCPCGSGKKYKHCHGRLA